MGCHESERPSKLTNKNLKSYKNNKQIAIIIINKWSIILDPIITSKFN